MGANRSASPLRCKVGSPPNPTIPLCRLPPMAGGQPSSPQGSRRWSFRGRLCFDPPTVPEAVPKQAFPQVGVVAVGRLDVAFKPNNHGRQLPLATSVQPPYAAHLGRGWGCKFHIGFHASRHCQCGAQRAWTRAGAAHGTWPAGGRGVERPALGVAKHRLGGDCPLGQGARRPLDGGQRHPAAFGHQGRNRRPDCGDTALTAGFVEGAQRSRRLRLGPSAGHSRLGLHRRLPGCRTAST